MPCIVALIVFGIMGIFSASQRTLAREALDCVFRRVTFRPCNTGFQEKVKGKLLAKALNRSVFLAKILNKYYEIFSWVFFIIMVGSTFWVLRGVYNFYVYGSCNGLNSTSFCAFDPSGLNNQVTGVEDSSACGVVQKTESNLTLENVDLSTYPTKNVDSKDTVVFMGCYACKNSRKAYPNIEKLVAKKNPNFIFGHFPVKGTITDTLANASYCVAKNSPEKFWDWNSYLFTEDMSYVLDPANLDTMLLRFNLDVKKTEECINDPATKEAVDAQTEELKKTNVYGTPTVFINGKAYVGPKPFRVYHSAINKFIFF